MKNKGLLALLALLVGGGIYYFLRRRKKQQALPPARAEVATEEEMQAAMDLLGPPPDAHLWAEGQPTSFGQEKFVDTPDIAGFD